MSIVVFSSSCYDTGRDIAEKVAEATGFRYVDREILGPVAEIHNLPEEDLVRALDEPPNLFGLSARRRDKYIALIQQATLERLLEDNVVCHGLAAHLYVCDVSHAIMVRILPGHKNGEDDPAPKTGEASEKTGKHLKRQERDRKRICLHVFDRNEADASIYDMVINLSRMNLDEAIQTIVNATSFRKFQSMTYSINCLKNKELECRVRMKLLDRFPNARVQADGNTVNVRIKPNIGDKRKRIEEVKEQAWSVEGVTNVKVVYG